MAHTSSTSCLGGQLRGIRVVSFILCLVVPPLASRSMTTGSHGLLLSSYDL